MTPPTDESRTTMEHVWKQDRWDVRCEQCGLHWNSWDQRDRECPQAEKFVASEPSQAATYWQARALRAEAKLAELDATLTDADAWAQAREDGLT